MRMLSGVAVASLVLLVTGAVHVDAADRVAPGRPAELSKQEQEALLRLGDIGRE